MLKPPAVKGKSKELSLKVQKYGKIVAPYAKSTKNDLNKSAIELKKGAGKLDKSFEAVNKSYCQQKYEKTEIKQKPCKTTGNRTVSRCSKKTTNKGSLADAQVLVSPEDEQSKNNITELIEKAKEELDSLTFAKKNTDQNFTVETETGDSMEILAENKRIKNDHIDSLKPMLDEKNEILAELKKWKEFGHLLTESYDQLKKKYTEKTISEAKDHQIIEALKEQVTKLKALLNHSSVENRNLREEIENINLTVHNLKKEKETIEKCLSAKCQEIEILQNEKILNNKLVGQLNDKIKKLKNELGTAKNNDRQIETLPDEISDRQTEFFKKMSEKNLEQAGTLAEQLICLRSDLDRSHFDILRIQRQRSTSLSACGTYTSELGLKKSESDCELLKPNIHPPKPLKMDSFNTAGHSRKESKDSQRSEKQDTNKSLLVARTILNSTKSHLSYKSEKNLKSAPTNKLLPPRIPLVAQYHSNNKNFGSVIQKNPIKS